MKKKMGLFALGLSMALFSGCGSVDDVVNDLVDDQIEEQVDQIEDQVDQVEDQVDQVLLNTPTEVTKNIVGNWLTACVTTDSGSEIERLIFEAAGTGQYKSGYFSAPGCNDADAIGSEEDTFNYTIGEATTGSNGEAAVELDYGVSGETYYSMVNFATVDKMNTATSDDGDTNDGGTPETRENVFESEWAFTRQ